MLKALLFALANIALSLKYTTPAMLIRKNTKAFKTILEIVSACQSRPDREQLIRLFITKAGSTINERISVDSIQGDAALFYEMNYQTVLNSLRSSNHQLNESDEIPGLYFFHSASNKRWDETPFEFDEAVKTEFSTLPDLPTVRKKGKSEKYVLPKAQKLPKTTEKKAEKVVEVKVKKAVVQKGPKQPDFKLKHKIEFADLDKIIFRQPKLTKEAILTYYNTISDVLLPYIKDRQQWFRGNPNNSRALVELTRASLFGEDEDSAPEWLHATNGKKGNAEEPMLINDKEHLLLAVDRGALEFHPGHSRKKQSDYADYCVIIIDSPESDISKGVRVAREAKTVLDGLKLPAFIKTDGLSGLHIYIPLDAKTDFKQSREAAMYVCKLIKLKVPDLVALVGSDDNTYGKVSLDYTLNEDGQSIIAPYSLVASESVTVATPLLWDEVEGSLQPNSFDVESIFKRLKRVGDPFAQLHKKKVNGAELVERLEEGYGFLI